MGARADVGLEAGTTPGSSVSSSSIVPIRGGRSLALEEGSSRSGGQTDGSIGGGTAE
jgi:hypothetical protein